MKKFRTNQLHTLNQAGILAARSKKSILLSVFFFLTGISTGIFLELTMAPDEKNNLLTYLQQYLYTNSSSMDYPNPFLSSLSNNLLLLLIIFLAGLSTLGFPAALAAVAYKGMALGFCTGLIIEMLEGQGALTVFTTLVPQNLILIPDFILAASGAVNYAFYCLNSRKKASKKSLKEVSGSYIVLFAMLALAIGLACALEAILYPVVH